MQRGMAWAAHAVCMTPGAIAYHVCIDVYMYMYVCICICIYRVSRMRGASMRQESCSCAERQGVCAACSAALTAAISVA